MDMTSITLTPMPDDIVSSGGQGLQLQYEIYHSPFGDLLLVSSSHGLSYALFDGEVEALVRVRKDYPNADITRQRTAHHWAALSYFKTGTEASLLSLALKGTAFQLQVWQALLKVPLGQTASYKQICEHIGRPNSSRAVGSAVGRNPVTFYVPCHRILAHNGGLGGYYWGLDKKRALLSWEGVSA
jgi:AraC family transcriptional regulator of adaptative response/methylated-DNA-[protein]-cysteine methyltransferase